MIKVSDTASKKIISMMQEDGFDAAKDYVRVGVKSGGCSGLSYDLKFDKEIGENDKIFEDNNVKIAVEKKSFLYLAGTILEFSGGLNGKGFVFNNPNAQRTCGCGESFWHDCSLDRGHGAVAGLAPPRKHPAPDCGHGIAPGQQKGETCRG